MRTKVDRIFQLEQGVEEMEIRKIIGWCILIPFMIVFTYVTIMMFIAKPLSLIGLLFVALFFLGIFLVT